MNCICGKPLGYRQRMFCSIPCRNRANGKKTGGWNRNKFALMCQFCGKTYEVPKNRLTKSRHCSRQCHNTAISRYHDSSEEKNHMWKGGIQTYRRKRKSSCERCGSTRYLDVHHKNENRYDNRDANLETLCRRCHHKHHDRARNFTKNSSFLPLP